MLLPWVQLASVEQEGVGGGHGSRGVVYGAEGFRIESRLKAAERRACGSKYVYRRSCPRVVSTIDKGLEVARRREDVPIKVSDADACAEEV